MFLANVVASGTKESIGGALLTGLLGYIVVFIGLILLMIVVIITSKIVMARKPKEAVSSPAAPSAAPAAPAPAPGSAGKLKLYDTPDKEAAMIMAIVANQMGRPLNELRFISIKEVK